MGKRLRTLSYILLFGLLIGGLVYQLFLGNISSLGRTALGYFAAGDYVIGIFAPASSRPVSFPPVSLASGSFRSFFRGNLLPGALNAGSGDRSLRGRYRRSKASIQEL